MLPADSVASRAQARHELDEVHAGLQDLEGYLHEAPPTDPLYGEIVAHVDQGREVLRRAEEFLRRADEEART